MAHSRSPAVASAGTVTGFGTPAVVEKEKECGLVNDSGLSLSSKTLVTYPFHAVFLIAP